MINSNVPLNVSPLFVGLTRPAMIMGITIDYFCISVLIALCSFILTTSPLYLLVYLPLHVMGGVGCAIDHNIFRILSRRAECLSVTNKKIWGAQSYEPF